MTATALLALLPVIAVAGASVVAMLAIAFRRHGGLAYAVTLLGLALSLALLPLSLSREPVAVTGLLRIDAYALLFGGAAAGAALFVAVLCHAYFRQREREEIYILLLTATLGGMLLAASTHFAMLFLGLEILSVSLFPLIAFRSRHRASLEAGIKYLILSGISSALLLFGIGLVYSATGTLWLAETGSITDPVLLVGTLMVIAGLGFKLSLVPFHMWTPDVYEGAPAPIAAFIATVSKASVFAMLVRLWSSHGAHHDHRLLALLSVIAAASILFGNLLALLQSNLKRMLGYSSVAHMGYALAAFISGSVLETAMLPESVTFYLLAYIVTNLAAFGTVSVLSGTAGECDRFEHYRGLFWKSPGPAIALTASLLSLAGIPLTIGFIGKFYVFATGTDAGLWALLAAVVVGSGIGLYFYLRVIWTLLEPVADEFPAESAGGAAKPALALLVLLVLAGGLFPEPVLKVIREIAKSLT
jgi:NADH-quinone oxidoreductase subunit N